MFKRFVLAIIAILLTSTILFADGDNLHRYPLYKQTAPMHCGPLKAVNQMLEVEGFKPWALGFGKAGAKFNGQIVYAVMFYKHTLDPLQVVMTIETPQQIEKCILHVLWNFVSLPKGKIDEPKKEKKDDLILPKQENGSTDIEDRKFKLPYPYSVKNFTLKVK